jgi:hypothetical protein
MSHPHSIIAQETKNSLNINNNNLSPTSTRHPHAILAALTSKLFSGKGFKKRSDSDKHPHKQIAELTSNLFSHKSVGEEEDQDGNGHEAEGEEEDQDGNGAEGEEEDQDGNGAEEKEDTQSVISGITEPNVPDPQPQSNQMISFDEDDDGNLECKYDADKYLLIGMVDDYCILYDKVNDKIYNQSLNDDEEHQDEDDNEEEGEDDNEEGEDDNEEGEDDNEEGEEEEEKEKGQDGNDNEEGGEENATVGIKANILPPTPIRSKRLTQGQKPTDPNAATREELYNADPEFKTPEPSDNGSSVYVPSNKTQEGGGKIHLTKDELDRLNKRILGSIKKIVN